MLGGVVSGIEVLDTSRLLQLKGMRRLEWLMGVGGGGGGGRLYASIGVAYMHGPS